MRRSEFRKLGVENGSSKIAEFDSQPDAASAPFRHLKRLMISMISKKSGLLLFGTLFLLVTLAVVITSFSEPRLTSDELFVALRNELEGRAAWGRLSHNWGVDAELVRVGHSQSPSIFERWLGWNKAQDFFGAEEGISITLTDRGVTLEVLRLINRTPSVHELILELTAPLDDEEIEVFSKMKGLEITRMEISRYASNYTDLERLHHLPDIRALNVRPEKMNSRVVASLALLKSLVILNVYLPADCGKLMAGEAYDMLTKALPDCSIYLASPSGFNVP